MTPTLNRERERFFERGGPAYRLMQRIGSVRGDDPTVKRRIVACLTLPWIPLIIEKVLDTLGEALL